MAVFWTKALLNPESGLNPDPDLDPDECFLGQKFENRHIFLILVNGTVRLQEKVSDSKLLFKHEISLFYPFLRNILDWLDKDPPIH